MTPIYILFGTETYNAQDLADRTAEAVEALSLPVEVFGMDELDWAEMTAAHTVLIITSTFGDGEPPSNAEELHAELMAATTALPHLRFSVCSLGDSSYPKFCQCGIEFDERLAALGAQRIAARVDCDVDFEGPWQGWLDANLAALGQLSFEAAPAVDVAPAPVAQPAAPVEQHAVAQQFTVPAEQPAQHAHQAVQAGAQPVVEARPKYGRQSPYRYLTEEEAVDYADLATQAYIRLDAPAVAPPKKAPKAPPEPGSRKNPYIATILENYNLNTPGTAKETRHLSISLKGSGVTYKVGDALGLFPNNCPDVVRRIVHAAGLRGDEIVRVGVEDLPLRTALAYRLDCVQIDNKLYGLAASTGYREQHAFEALSRDAAARTAFSAANHVIDVVDGSWMRPEPQALVDAMRPLGPRLYSISSSPLAHPDEVHLTVDVVRYEMNGTLRKGISSSFIGERCGPGVKVPVYIRPSGEFGLVDDDMAPIIMVGPGTGLAPFRAFLEEREARGAKGYSWLFFGARQSEHDFLYRAQVERWRDNGVLTRLDLAFSRDQARKIYVQTKMREHGADLFAWLDAGSYFYICGDASRMAKDVNDALIEIICTYGGYDRAGADAYLERMHQEGRYQRDVY